MTNKKISIVVPCFNEKDNLIRTYTYLTQIISKTVKRYELIFIENGSTDNSVEIFKKLIKKDSNLTVIQLSRNFGPHGAYECGLSYATGDAVVFIDCDLQDPPELIPKMIKEWNSGYDVVYGVRKQREGNPMVNLLKISYYRLLHQISNPKIPLNAADFSLMDRKVVNVLRKLPERNKYFTGLRAWVGFNQIGIEYRRRKRVLGKTKFNLIDYFRWASNGIFSFSYKPLELILYLGMMFLILTFIDILIYFFGFLSLRISDELIIFLMFIFFICAVQLFCLSIIARYVAQINEQVKNRPGFIVKGILRK